MSMKFSTLSKLKNKKAKIEQTFKIYLKSGFILILWVIMLIEKKNILSKNFNQKYTKQYWNLNGLVMKAYYSVAEREY